MVSRGIVVVNVKGDSPTITALTQTNYMRSICVGNKPMPNCRGDMTFLSAQHSANLANPPLPHCSRKGGLLSYSWTRPTESTTLAFVLFYHRSVLLSLSFEISTNQSTASRKVVTLT